MPTLKQILAPGYDVNVKYIKGYDELGVLVQLLRTGGFRIALTQGVYDMFHIGHGRYLAEASSCGDVLIVGVDSDELTRQMKGDDRPFDTFNERVELLAMLSFVHIIAKRDVGEHKYDLIKQVRPDVLVMSKTTRSFGEEDLAALNEHCGEIKYLEARAATSTTAKLRRLKIGGAKELADKLSGRVQSFSNELVGILKDVLEGDSDAK
jgi:cytidyltransferase-like protein